MKRSNLAWVAPLLMVSVFFLTEPLMWAEPEDLGAALRNNALVIDVRTEGEFARGWIPGVTNVPLDRLEKEIASLAPDCSKPILLHCASGGRSASGCITLKRMGYTRVYNLGSFSRARELITANRAN